MNPTDYSSIFALSSTLFFKYKIFIILNVCAINEKVRCSSPVVGSR